MSDVGALGLWFAALVVLSAVLTWAMRREHKRNEPKRYGWIWVTTATTGQMYQFTLGQTVTTRAIRPDDAVRVVKYADDEKVKAIVTKIRKEDAELLRRLAR